MKKLFLFFAAMLVAVAVSAQEVIVTEPIALPATLDVTNVTYRSEGMPDFVIEEGQDYAGTYFDMGAHDSSNDTLLYAEWDVTIEPITYNIAVDVYNTNSWRVQLYLLNLDGDTVKSLRYKGSSGQKGQFAIGSIDMSDLEAGVYTVRARAATGWSAMKLKDVIFEADYHGVNVNLPGTLFPAYAELSAGASVTNNAIAFKPSTANTEYATWNVSFAKAGSYNVSIDITASNGHNYGVTLLDGEKEVGVVNEGGQHGDTGVKELGAISVPAAGNYVVKLTNATQWSEAVLNGITFTAPASTTKTIYLNDGVWADADAARYEVYCITNESWVTLTAVANTNNLYSAEIPETVTQVVYCRMDPTKPEGEWSSLQNQTEDLTIPDGKDLFTITGWGEGWGAKCNGVWSKYGEEYVPVLENGFYLVGTFGGEEEWSIADLNESKKFAATEVEGEYTLNYTLAKGDLFKAVYVENDAIKTWYPEGTGNDYLVTEWTAGEKTIYFRPTYNEAWGGHFYIEANKPEVTYSDFEIDLRAGQLGTDTENPNNAYLTVSGEQYKYSQEMPLAYNAYLTSDKYNGAQHGYTNLVVTMPVEAGNYKLTLGTCQFGNGAGSIMKADGSVTYKTFDQKAAACYDANKETNVISVVFSVAEAQMIKIVCGNYTPYIKVEQVANIEYAVTFAVEEGVRGIVPAPVAIVDGESLTIPANTTLYLDGKTLTGWSDGENTYAPGDVFTPKADATLTAVFAENTASLLTATVPVTVQWNFGLTEGAPTVAWEGENKGMGFLVAQATIGETKVDVPLDVNATNGKFNNSGRKDYWAQVNAGTELYFPAKKGAEVEVFTYADPATTTVDKATQTGTWTDNKSQFITTATIDASIMEVKDGRYYRYLKVTYPASEATAISNTEAEVKAQKVIENGQIFILKNGVKYNVLGASVK